MAKRQYTKGAFEDKIERIPECGCWIWMAALTHFGYGATRFRGKVVATHRLSWLMHRGDIPSGMHVLHRCDVTCCVNPSHLFLGTHRDNMLDMRAKKRAAQVYGRKSVLTESTVLGILESLAAGESGYGIAKRLGINAGTVSKIKHGLRWSHLRTTEKGIASSVLRNG